MEVYSAQATFEAKCIEIDDLMCEETGQPRGTFIEILTTFLPILLQILPNLCKRKVPDPAPIPIPNPTPAQQAAYLKAHEAKYKAQAAYNPEEADYDEHALRKAARQLKRQKKRDGEEITMPEAVELNRKAFSVARTTPIMELAAAIEHAQTA